MIGALKQRKRDGRRRMWREKWACPSTRFTPEGLKYGGMEVSQAQEAKHA